MESLALVQSALSTPTPRLQRLERFSFRLPNALWLKLFGMAVAIGILSSSLSAHATVRRGDRCEAVTTVQAALVRSGFDVGSVDGIFGGQTQFAVQQFQTRQKLSVDGVVGPATAGALGIPTSLTCGTTNSGGGGGTPSSGTFRVSTNGGALNIRSTPGGPVIGFAPNGTLVTITSTSQNWAALNTGGWVSRDFLASASSGGSSGGGGTPGGTPGVTTYRIATNGGALTVRQTPNGSAIGSLPNGTTIRVVRSDSSGWLNLEQGGWVSSTWVK